MDPYDPIEGGRKKTKRKEKFMTTSHKDINYTTGASGGGTPKNLRLSRISSIN
jgi:hypothetical protein